MCWRVFSDPCQQRNHGYLPKRRFNSRIDNGDKSGINNIPFFQSFDTSGNPTGKAMLYGELLRELKKDLADVTDTFPELVPDDYGTHAFRRMGASIAKCNGVPDDLIQYMGRWVSQCFQRYFIFSDNEKMRLNGMILS